MKQTYSVLFLFLSFTFSAFAQEANEKEKERLRGVLINASYGFSLPIADMNKDYGAHSDFGFGIQYLYDHFIFGAESNFIFGNRVKTDVLAKLRAEDGGIITSNGELGPTNLSERGMYLGVLAGRIIPLGKKNRRSGIRLTVGTGFLQHKIRIEDSSESIPQLADEYKKGYDHLTNGWATKEFVGYHYLSNNGRVNFFAGVEATQGFTQNRRDFNFDTLMKDDSKRLDAYFGFRLGWTIAIYSETSQEIFYY